jgi:hypothetical protein
MRTCSFYRTGASMPRCSATEEGLVPPLAMRERFCLQRPEACPVHEAALRLGGQVPPNLHALLTMPIAPVESPPRLLARLRRGG